MVLRRWLGLLVLLLLQSPREQGVAAQSGDFTGTTYRIDCGGSENFTSAVNQQWLADMFYTGGLVADLGPDAATKQDKTIRYFPPQMFGYKSCYQIPVPNGRYYIRMYFAYFNYDKKNRGPKFDVSVEGTIVFSFDSPWEVDEAAGAYSDAYAFVEDGEASICFYSENDVPLIGTLEIVQVDNDSYMSAETGKNVILVTYARVTTAIQPFGSGLTTDGAEGGRVWYPPVQIGDFDRSVRITTSNPIMNTNIAPNYYPQLLYQSARVANSNSGMIYSREVDADFDYAVWLHFAEIAVNVGPGQRVFNVSVNGVVSFGNLDIIKEAGGPFTALDKYVMLKNLTTPVINITFISITGMPALICGVEIFALLPVDAATDPIEARAMHSLKASLQVPDRMGWNGDPCAPSNWHTWEGVDCYLGEDDRFFITDLDVPEANLGGQIDSSITLLSHLIHLNLSNNNLNGSIPSGLGSGVLQSVDLSSNKLTGKIPESLGSQQLVTVLLDDNQLVGSVPPNLYSIGVRGGSVNILNNKALCGVSGLPDCPSFWDKGGLSSGAKAGVALGVIFVLVLFVSVLYLCIQRRRRHDYSFRVSPQNNAKSKGLSRYLKYATRPRASLDDMQIMRNVPSRFGFSNLTPL